MIKVKYKVNPGKTELSDSDYFRVLLPEVSGLDPQNPTTKFPVLDSGGTGKFCMGIKIFVPANTPPGTDMNIIVKNLKLGPPATKNYNVKITVPATKHVVVIPDGFLLKSGLWEITHYFVVGNVTHVGVARHVWAV